ncbi:MAG: cytochrome c biogenesis protein ResB [Candidatus Limnocylindrales bacterium]
MAGRRPRLTVRLELEIATVTLGWRRTSAYGDPFTRLGGALWATFTDVRFAVLQIILVAVAGVIGALLRQIPAAALHDPAGYAAELADLHRRYDPLTLLGVQIGPTMTDVFEALGFFRIFSAPWFAILLSLLAVSIVVCTLDRTPRLWHSVRDVRVRQPAPFFDLQLHQRAALEEQALAPEAVAAVFRRRHYAVRTERDEDGVAYVYGDRNRYFRLATLLTHLGLILFLVGAAVTGAFGFEAVLFVGEGQTAPVQPVGTPGNLLVKNLGFEAPQRADGSFVDFRTDLAVYRDGQEIARQVIRVNEPLTVDGFVFHQNTFGPAEDLTIRTADGTLVWQGPVILDGQLQGQPQGFLTIPGDQVGLLAVLGQDGAGAPRLNLLGVSAGQQAGQLQPEFAAQLHLGGQSDPAASGGYAISWTKSGAFSGMVVKRDPGQPLIWIAFLCLISGLVLSFYFPRRRVWARLESGRVQLALLADRYVPAGREFEQLLVDLTARPAPQPQAP